ncbi:MAG TPA: hypothetical protein VIR78_03135 [Malonomonas sp.]
MYSSSSSRRKKTDPLLRLLTVANVTAAASLFVVFCLTAMAKPEIETFFDRFYKVNLYRRPNWDMNLMNYIGLMLVICCIVSLAGLYINSKRLRRKGDYIRATQVVSLIIALFGLALYLKHMLTYVW